MGVYIRIKMPESCDSCPMNSDWRCVLRINTPHQHNIDAGAWKYRMEWCPLVEVPVPHGRLVEFIEVAKQEEEDSGTELIEFGDVFLAYMTMREEKPVIEAEGK